MPYYRHSELENGLTQQDVTAFGTVAFSPVVGMFYELPVAQYRDFSGVPGFPTDTDSKAIGVGDVSLKFLIRPKFMDFNYGKEGNKSGSVLFGTDFVLPTATDDALGGDAFIFAPISGGCARHACLWIFRHVEPLLPLMFTRPTRRWRRHGT